MNDYKLTERARDLVKRAENVKNAKPFDRPGLALQLAEDMTALLVTMATQLDKLKPLADVCDRCIVENEDGSVDFLIDNLEDA